MAALTCDICGGKLIMGEGGEYAACESCGLQHNKDRIKQKVQEITGTVKVDGSVQVEGVQTLEKILENATTLLKLEQPGAKELYKRATEEYPEDYRGWMGLADCISHHFTRVTADYYLLNSWDYYCQDFQNYLNTALNLTDSESVKKMVNEKLADYLSCFYTKYIPLRNYGSEQEFYFGCKNSPRNPIFCKTSNNITGVEDFIKDGFKNAEKCNEYNIEDVFKKLCGKLPDFPLKIKTKGDFFKRKGLFEFVNGKTIYFVCAPRRECIETTVVIRGSIDLLLNGISKK